MLPLSTKMKTHRLLTTSSLCARWIQLRLHTRKRRALPAQWRRALLAQLRRLRHLFNRRQVLSIAGRGRRRFSLLALLEFRTVVLL